MFQEFSRSLIAFAAMFLILSPQKTLATPEENNNAINSATQETNQKATESNKLESNKTVSNKTKPNNKEPNKTETKGAGAKASTEKTSPAEENESFVPTEDISEDLSVSFPIDI
ncbi:hypothetical protein [Marinibactrum halimedae]|uniref:Uncharacterized protein n=1 Tax=Marinibactrum halimedae TaxID=1444977 RepID=A0AA37TC98_9GAMM|nr:hypothetical protein [Marinibactrum halimedae]MCD9458044.1 hypothetical protein [Marinibactrum halimedae]GLS27671.1 hypothetical protein GCM10007877_33900 [Marinibactrum halimedae]